MPRARLPSAGLSSGSSESKALQAPRRRTHPNSPGARAARPGAGGSYRARAARHAGELTGRLLAAIGRGPGRAGPEYLSESRPGSAGLPGPGRRQASNSNGPGPGPLRPTVLSSLPVRLSGPDRRRQCQWPGRRIATLIAQTCAAATEG